MCTAKEKYLKWFEKEKKERGLVDVKLFPGTAQTTSDQVFETLLYVAENFDTDKFTLIAAATPSDLNIQNTK